MTLRSQQKQFANALQDPKAAVPDDLRGRNGAPSPKRFAVYRNNVRVSLVEALMATFPATLMIVGEEFFRAAASVYVRQDPPDSPVLISYGSGFADFLAGFGPAAGLAYLPDVARVEIAWVQAYHAADRPTLASEALGALAPDRLMGARFDPHPSTRIIRSQFPIVTIWEMNRSGSASPVDMTVAEATLVTRPEMDVEVRRLPAGGPEFLSALVAGASLGEAAGQALSDHPDFDLAGNISGMLEAGAFTGLADIDQRILSAAETAQ